MENIDTKFRMSLEKTKKEKALVMGSRRKR
jgi:hypothetical protein